MGLAAAAASWGVARVRPQQSPGATASTAPSHEPVAAACKSSLQPLIDAAPAGSSVVLPACLARETLVINKPLTVVGAPGSEIRGSDVWSDWRLGGAGWVSALTVPAFRPNGHCAEGTSRCQWPEQVFVDGSPLEQVAQGTQPGPGQFSLDGDRHVTVSDPPLGRMVEVTTRERWIEPKADGIVIAGLRMGHAADAAQDGAIADGGHLVSIRDCVMSDTHGPVVSLTGRGELTGNDISRGGQLGVHGSGALVADNRIHDNNTEGFDPGWEAGGLKTNRPAGVIEGNEIYANDGPGIWLDGAEGSYEILRNRVHDNRGAGILYEISRQGRIASNSLWANGFGDPVWGWGGGIVLSTSLDVQVDHNVLAWNADGISVISQRREDAPGSVAHVAVQDNVIAGKATGPDAKQNYGLAWLQDWPGRMFDPAEANRGSGNLFWYAARDEPSSPRFAWDGDIARLSAFGATPGGTASRYVTEAESQAALGEAGVPATP